MGKNIIKTCLNINCPERKGGECTAELFILVCNPCGVVANYLTCLKKYGAPPLKPAFYASTYHQGVCDFCGRETHVTEARDFFHPDFSLILKVKNYLYKEKE